jgi:nucleoside 2-deoxyribosyltransferase
VLIHNILFFFFFFKRSAGPDVFHPNAAEIGVALSDLCRAHSLEPLWPLDGNKHLLESPHAAELIYGADIDLLSRSSAVVACIAPWRGPNADPGTAFEIGWAVARGIPVFLYTTPLVAWPEVDIWRALDEKIFPRAGEFGHAENLMLCVPAQITVDTAEKAIVAAADHLGMVHNVS